MRFYLLLASLVAAAAAQSTITLASTAGVPATPNAGNGESVATYTLPPSSQATFATTPSSFAAATPAVTLTGSALSAYEASIASRNSQVSGMTGIGQVSGISVLGPGYAASLSASGSAASASSSGRPDGAPRAVSGAVAAWAGLGAAAVAAGLVL